MANIIPSPSGAVQKIEPQKSFASTKRLISNMFYKSLNRHMDVDKNGESVTYLQAMVDGVVDMATDKERDDYVRLAATKFVTEHLEGKAGTMQDETHEEMPQIVINVKNMNLNNIQNNASALKDAVPQNDIISEIEAEYTEVIDGESD